MSSITRIKENRPAFTSVEIRIADYIVENRLDAINMTAQELADATKTSASAIVRFSKKIGYDGFTQLKLELAKHNDVQKQNGEFDSIIRESDNFATMTTKLQQDYINSINTTFSLIQQDVMQATISAIKKSRRIYLYAIGGSAVVAEDFYQKLVRIDKNVIFIKDFHLLMSALTYADKHDIFVSLSYSGNTKEVVNAQKVASQNGTTTVAITRAGSNEIHKYSDFIINLPQTEQELRLGFMGARFAMLTATDLLYLGVASESPNKTREKIIKTRESIKNID